MAVKNVGTPIIVASPSGGGKTSLVNKMVSALENIEISVSHTTRKLRPREQDGIDYFFITEEQFLAMIKEKAFVEYAWVYNHYYGTSVAQVQKRLEQGIDVVLDIDWQGAQQIRKIFPQAISIFIIPPSLSVLEQRLQNRRQDDEQVIGDRMRRAQDELGHFEEFDYLIVNDDFDKASLELQAIVIANRLGKARQMVKLVKLLSFLLTPQ